MSMPFYVAPEQVMKDRADYARKGIARGRSVVAVQYADGVLFVTPEYNHGVPGVMKNAVDWASRPARAAPLGGKPVGIIGASPGQVGTARGQSQLRQAFEFTNSFCLPQPEILVFRAHEKFDAAGELTDEKTAEYLVKYLQALRDWVLRFK